MSKKGTQKIFVDTRNAETGSARKKYEQIIKGIAGDGVCPFCSEYLTTYHKKPRAERTHWWVTDNMYPYHPVRHHFLFIHKAHIEHIAEISDDAWRELRELIKEKKVAGGSLVLRFGDTRFTGASVAHLHAHLVQSNPEHTDYQKPKTVSAGVAMRVG